MQGLFTDFYKVFYALICERTHLRSTHAKAQSFAAKIAGPVNGSHF